MPTGKCHHELCYETFLPLLKRSFGDSDDGGGRGVGKLKVLVKSKERSGEWSIVIVAVQGIVGL